MPPRRPIAQLPTHEVANTPPHLGDQDLWSQDIVLQEGVLREGAAATHGRLLFPDFGVIDQRVHHGVRTRRRARPRS